MKVLLLSRTLARSGGMVIVSTLVRELVQQGVDISFVAFKPEGTPDIPDDAQDLYQDLPLTVYAIPRRDNPEEQLDEYIKAAADYLRQHHEQYDKIILDSWYSMIAGALAQIIDSPKVFHLVQRDPVFVPEHPSKIWTAYTFELAGLFKMQRVVVGRSLVQTFQERYGVVYPALDLYIDNTYRQKNFVVSNRQPVKLLASAANFNLPWKGLDFLLEQLEQFSEYPFSLTLVTTNPINRDLTNLPFPVKVAAAYNPAEMRDLLLAHDIYLCASTSESFCLALAEAITLGMPAIALDSVGNRDYARGDNFYFVRDKADFLGQLAKICQLDNRRQLHKAARDSMAQYTVDHMVRQFMTAVGL
jgi:glycosyltransferase involved in cell wall biosynthesis